MQVRRPKGVSGEREAFVSHAAQASVAACSDNLFISTYSKIEFLPFCHIIIYPDYCDFSEISIGVWSKIRIHVDHEILTRIPFGHFSTPRNFPLNGV